MAHDWLCGLRGGEWVLDRVLDVVRLRHELAGLYVMFDDGRPLTPGIDAARARESLHVSRIGTLPGASGPLRRWALPLYPAAVASLGTMLDRDHRARPIDLLISTSSAAVKGLRAPPGVPHLCYCHSPARYIWSRGDEYSGGLRGMGLALWRKQFADWDRDTAANVTRFLANSTHTQAEIQRCYGRDAGVVFPPVRTDFLTPPAADTPSTRSGDWLVVSALEPYKQVELAIDAANKAGHALTIVGSGSRRRALERRAGATVRFAGRVDDDELRARYRGAGLLLFPQVEDFGIVAVEAQACGLPVVARRAGGALDTVVEGVTGRLFDGGVDELLAAVAVCPRGCAAACRAQALRFTVQRFDETLAGEVASIAQLCV